MLQPAVTAPDLRDHLGQLAIEAWDVRWFTGREAQLVQLVQVYSAWMNAR
jgi:hypothetical protein